MNRLGLKKKGFGVMGVVVLLLILLVAGPKAGAEEDEILELKPSTAIERSLEHSLDLKMAEINLANAEIEYERSKAEDVGTTSRYNELQAELQIDQANQEYKEEKENLIISTVEQYMEILSREEEISIMEKQQDLQERQVEVTEAQYEAGHIGRLELAEVRHDRDDVVMELKHSRRDLEQKKQEFKDLLGLTEEADLTLLEVERPEVMEREEEEVIEKIVGNDFTLEVEARQVELAEVDLERGKVAGVSTLEEEQLVNNLKQAELSLENSRRGIRSSAQSQYNSFLRTADGLESSEQSLKQERENFSVTQEQYRAGIQTENDLLAAEIELLEAENSYNEAIVDYLISELNLRQNMGQDLGSVYDEQLVD